MASVRNSVKAVIVRDGHVLLIKNKNSQGVHYLFPGGGQEHGEDLHSALKRECIEEIGAHVDVGRLRFIRDYIAKNHEFAATGSDAHQLELYFECTLLPGEEPRNGDGADTHQIDVEWIPIASLPQIPLYPKFVQKGWDTFFGDYLGDVN